jgi:hypothetical protein
MTEFKGWGWGWGQPGNFPVMITSSGHMVFVVLLYLESLQKYAAQLCCSL